MTSAHDLAAALVAWGADLAWQAALLAGAVAAADRLLARRGVPHLRHALWLLVLAKFALPPSLGSPVGLVGALRDAEAAPLAAAEGASGAPVLAAALAWAAGTVLLAGVAVVRTRRLLRSLAAGRVPVPGDVRAAVARAAAVAGLRRAPRVLVSTAADGIALVGVVRPALVVPFPVPPAVELHHALLHEAAHLRRRDLLVAAAATVARCVFWWHPAAWLASARLADLREVCCDVDAAASLGPAAPRYRETLLGAARRLVAAPRTAGVAWLGGRTGLAARLDALSRSAAVGRSRAERAATAAAVVVAAACAVPMGAAAAPDAALAAEVAAARAVLSGSAGDAPAAGCLRRRFAAMRLAAADLAPTEGTSR